MRKYHSSLHWMLHQKEPRDQLARWVQWLLAYQFTTEHRLGKKHGNADGMLQKCFHLDPDDEELKDPDSCGEAAVQWAS